jgi:FkbM family methyltransferase
MINIILKKVKSTKNKHLRKSYIYFIYIFCNFFAKFNFRAKLNFNGICFYSPINHPSVFWSNLYPSVNSNLARVASSIHIFRPNSSFIDIGSNIGDTWAILRSTNSTNQILLIEGDIASFKWLKLNTATDSNVILWNGFIAPKNEGYQFEGSPNGSSGMLIKNSNNMNESIKSLDEVVAHTNFKNIGLIKVDTDGLDTLIVRSGKNTILEYCPVLFLEIQPYHLFRNDNFFSFLDFLKDLGYEHLILWDSNGRLVTCMSISNVDVLSDLLPYFSGAPDFLFLDIAFIHSSDSKMKDHLNESERLNCVSYYSVELLIDEKITSQFYKK